MNKMRKLAMGLVAVCISAGTVTGQQLTPMDVRVWLDSLDRFESAPQPNRPDLGPRMEGVKQTLPAGGRTMDQPLSAEMIRQVATLFQAEPRAEKIVAGFREGRAFVWLPGADPSRQLAVSVIRFDTPARAASYFGFAVDLQRQRDELMASACASTVRVHGSASQGVPWPGIDEGLRCDKQLEMLAARQILPTSVVLVRKGDTVLEFNGHGIGVDEGWAQRAAGVVLADSP